MQPRFCYNKRAQETLAAFVNGGRFPHALLLEGPEGSGRRTFAREIAAALFCRGEHKPCGSCNQCRKVLEQNHPDVEYYGGDGSRRSFHIDTIRQLRQNAWLLPGEAPCRVCVLCGAENMTDQAQNALLKILEEPPEYAVFLLLTDNPNKMLPTIRSRCTALNLNALPEETLRSALHREFPEAAKETLESALERSGGFLGQAKALMTQAESPQTKQFVEVYLNRKDRDYAELLCPMEKWKRDQLSQELTAWRALLADALLARGGMRASSPLAARIAEKRQGGDLLSAVDVLQKAIDYTQGNVSPAAVCGWLVWALR